MPDITVMVWNIQDFGCASPRFRGNYGPISAFIARAARQQKADIIFIMELTGTGVARLAQVRNALNNAYANASPAGNWYYDWIKGAFNYGLLYEANTHVTTSAQLGWTDQANGEGYAMFWNQNAEKFTMLNAPPIVYVANTPLAGNTMSNGVLPASVLPNIPAHALTLVSEGRPPTVDQHSKWAYQSPGFNPPGSIPAWNNLDFPYPRGPNLKRNASRRPCYCTINVNMAGPPPPVERIVPIMAYHAPSNRNPDAPPAGTQVSGFARQMYQAQDPTAGWDWINNARVIAGGDFNVNMNKATLPEGRQNSYAVFTNAFAAGVTGGAACTANVPVRLSNPINNTVVALNQYIGGPPIQSGQINAYRTAEFDNIFWRGFIYTPTPTVGRIYDLLFAVRPGGSLTGASVSNFLPLLNARMGTITREPGGNYVGPQPCTVTGNLLYPGILDFNAFHADVTAGRMTSPRRAAEFVKLFISDHLPIVFRFTDP